MFGAEKGRSSPTWEARERPSQGQSQFVLTNPGVRPGLTETSFQAGYRARVIIVAPEGGFLLAQGEALGIRYNDRSTGPERVVLGRRE